MLRTDGKDMAAPVFECRDIGKFFGEDRHVLQEVSLAVSDGEFHGIIGQNGAGKTTLIRVLIGLASVDHGWVAYRGRELSPPTLRELKNEIGYMPQSSMALNNLTVEDALFYTARLRGLGRRAARRDSGSLLERLELGAVRRSSVQRLSGGEKRRAQLGVVLAASPRILLLDEPSNDLDPIWREAVWRLLREECAVGGRTVLVVSHDVVGLDDVADAITVMSGGRILASGTPAELKEALGSVDFVEFAHIAPDLLPSQFRWLCDLPTNGGKCTAVIKSADFAHLLSECPEFLSQIVEFRRASLEDLYSYYFSGSGP